tara:strand:- start:66 stop:299 length:234 start_codon:yes stop_codon:yes gene_type:complete
MIVSFKQKLSNPHKTLAGAIEINVLAFKQTKQINPQTIQNVALKTRNPKRIGFHQFRASQTLPKSRQDPLNIAEQRA